MEDAGKPPEGFAFVREELRFENQLLVARVTAYITSQSFLFTAAAIGRGTHWRGFYWLSGSLLPLVGVVASAVILYVVYTAYGRMDEWREREKAFAGSHPLVVLYPDSGHRRSLLFTTIMPWLLMGVWVVLAVAVHAFHPEAAGM